MDKFEKPVNYTMLLIILGALIVLSIISYSIGYNFGSELGQDITQQVISSGRLTN